MLRSRVAKVSVGSSYEPQEAGPLSVEGLIPKDDVLLRCGGEQFASNDPGGSDQTFPTASPTPPIANTGGVEGATQITSRSGSVLGIAAGFTVSPLSGLVPNSNRTMAARLCVTTAPVIVAVSESANLSI